MTLVILGYKQGKWTLDILSKSLMYWICTEEITILIADWRT